MADTKKKRVVLTLEEKINAIKLMDRGTPAYKIAQYLAVGKTQIQNLRKRKQELLDDYENNVPLQSERRRYLTGNEEINELSWFKDAVSRRINVTGPLIQTKALDFAKSLGNTDFKASNGWLGSFIKRNNIVYGTMSGERGDVKEDCVNDWKRKLPTLCEGYHEKDIMNMDETGLFYRDTMRNTFHFKGNDCAGGKRSKERITVALCIVDGRTNNQFNT
ncbi:tigger transposable element-derived protein 4-like [Mercenaria mercenaria]|uniref:tigger transposable element-derived protein 4-like n=1 Tax=Mercenaria mercenaria TaxID=6596 RepID=UPI00234F16AC|nr:tigger transposable element-derived protein 4-like [Mercenaria mercenaria]